MTKLLLLILFLGLYGSCGESNNEEATNEGTLPANTSESSSENEKSGSPSNEQGGPGQIQFKIAAFNADILGKTKMEKASIASYIADIITQYDVILVQEIRDVSEETPAQLLTIVNKKNKGTYAMSVSTRLGRTSSKEQYVFYYKTSSGLTLESAEVYNDSADIFEREPYIVKFSKASHSFVLIGIHIKPTDAISELNQLDDVYNSVYSSINANEWIILGDLNADCSYISDTEMQNLDLTRNSFTWHIPKDNDTTVSNTECAYDNIISKSTKISNASINKFNEIFGIDAAAAEEVSNHYPVEFELKLGE